MFAFINTDQWLLYNKNEYPAYFVHVIQSVHDPY